MPKKTRYAGFQPHALTMAVALSLSAQTEAVSFTIGADSTPFGHSAHADPDTCSTIIRTGS
ncbi:hypothetical protein N0388_22460, partial [Pseudomonas aeruginosa]|nr:hypothetical protein [Pseudomonas aeruginosa]